MEIKVGHKDPIRNPVQKKLEGIFKSNYEKTLKVSQVRIAEILKNKK